MIRIVKLSFKENHRQDFLEFLELHKEKIRNFPGCGAVAFLNDLSDPTTFFTYSHWDSEDALETYRQSDLFKTVWSQVKQWFDQKAEAWSVEEL